MNPMLFTSHFTTFTQARPSLSSEELVRYAPSLIGTFRTCHDQRDDEASVSALDEIFRHIFSTDGGCNLCKEHYRSLQDSVAYLYRLL